MATADFHYDPLECTICLGSFTDPKILPCFHSFCLVCLEKHVKEDTVPADRHNAAYFTCPLCRKETTVPQGGVKAFQSNFYIDALKTQVVDSSNVEIGSARTDSTEFGSLYLLHGSGNHTQNQLAEMRFKASRIEKHLLELKQDCTEYTKKLLSDACDVRKEIEKMKQAACDRVNSVCAESICTLENELEKELVRAESYQNTVDALILRATAFEKEAEQSQKQDSQAKPIKTQITDEYAKIVVAIPAKLDMKKSLSLNKTTHTHEIITAQTVTGVVECKNLMSESAVGLPTVQDDPATTGTSKHGENQVDLATATPEIAGPETLGAEAAWKKESSNTPADVPSSSSDLLCDTESDVDTDTEPEESVSVSVPLLEDDLDPGNQEGLGAAGGIDPGTLSATGQNTCGAEARSPEPRVFCSFNGPIALEIKHICPHIIPGQAWVNFGQREPTVYLMDVQGHQIRMVATGGDTHDLTVLDEDTLVVANPAQKKIKQVDIDLDEVSERSHRHNYILPFSATSVAYDRKINTLAVAGKNNLLILCLSIANVATQMVIHSEQDILTKPCSVAFSHFSGAVVLAAADPGTRAVYIFAETDDPEALFTRENMFRYSGEGLGRDSLGQHTSFQPISISGRENMLAVLDKTTASIALLGQDFSVIGIVSGDELQVPSPRSIAFADPGPACWRVWLGTASGRIVIVDLPEFLCLESQD